MTIKVSVRRNASSSGSIDDLGDHEFVTLPREGEVIFIDGLGEGEVQRIEHLITSHKPPTVVIFIDD
jgi:hypothetical protein